MQFLPTVIAAAGAPAGSNLMPARAHLRGRLRTGTAMLALLAGILCVPVDAFADDLADVQTLVRQGNLTQATERLNAYLAKNPKDARARFLRGLVLTEQKRPADAIRVFVALTEDYPELPEPYNNLAVLYAGQGDLDKARIALEMAIRTNPSYAAAHENLGDVLLQLASQSYAKALQHEPRNASVPNKLSLIRNLLSPPVKSPPNRLPLANTTPANTTPSNTRPVTPASPAAKP